MRRVAQIRDPWCGDGPVGGDGQISGMEYKCSAICYGFISIVNNAGGASLAMTIIGLQRKRIVQETSYLAGEHICVEFWRSGGS